MRCIDNTKCRLEEGVLRTKELAHFLGEHRTKKIVWLSEDATAIVPKIKYDPKTNQVVGILLPTYKYGSPIPFR